MNVRAEKLAVRLEQGADALATLAGTLTDAEWKTVVPPDGRPVGVMIHHVASVYPIEIDLAMKLATGNPIAGVTWKDVHAMNAGHAKEHVSADRETTIALLRSNSATAAAAIRALSDEQLDRAATNSLYADAPLTAQHMLEDHAVRHSYHHLARIRAVLGR
jgi:hypothetical protein